MEHKLWTKDFTILTIGSAVSMLGNAVSGFALGLLILDYTNSTFLYSLTLVIYTLPRIVMPLLAGPYLDRFSRKRIYTPWTSYPQLYTF
jgi:MFS family permease